MTALNDQWQTARHLRQHEAMARRDQVYADLAELQSDRLTQAAQQRQILSQIVADLREETDLWLNQTAQQRQAQIPPLRQALQRYTEQLQVEVQTLLDDYQADRELNAADVRHRLAQDDQAMREAVSELRLDIAQDLQVIQQQVVAIQQQTAVDRAGYRQAQAMVKAELLPELADYVANLQVEVQSTLSDLTEARQETEARQRAQRHQDRQALTANVDAMFDRLAEFRRGLATQRAQLTARVWGNAEPIRPEVAPKVPKLTPRVPTHRAKAVPTPSTRPVAPRSAVAPRPLPTPPAVVAKPAPVAASAPMAQAVSMETLPKTNAIAQTPEPVVIEPTVPIRVPESAVATPSAPSSPQSPSLEEVVYNYLHLAQGARISEIETELGISRFQAVDALRSLIQKNLIVKQDRTYLAKEEAVL